MISSCKPSEAMLLVALPIGGIHSVLHQNDQMIDRPGPHHRPDGLRLWSSLDK
jgi:hypothetical protein